MTALETLTQSITGLTTAATDLSAAVDAAVTHIQTPGATDAQLGALTQAIDGVSTVIAAQTTRLNGAINEPPVVVV